MKLDAERRKTARIDLEHLQTNSEHQCEDSLHLMPVVMK